MFFFNTTIKVHSQTYFGFGKIQTVVCVARHSHILRTQHKTLCRRNYILFTLGQMTYLPVRFLKNEMNYMFCFLYGSKLNFVLKQDSDFLNIEHTFLKYFLFTLSNHFIDCSKITLLIKIIFKLLDKKNTSLQS